MRKAAVALAVLLLAAPVNATAETTLTCEGRARLKWTTCDRIGPAEGTDLVVRTCFGSGALGSFTGQMRVLIRGSYGGDSYVQVGDGEPITLIAARGCFVDSGGSSDPLVGDITVHVETRGRGYYSMTVETR